MRISTIQTTRTPCTIPTPTPPILFSVLITGSLEISFRSLETIFRTDRMTTKTRITEIALIIIFAIPAELLSIAFRTNPGRSFKAAPKLSVPARLSVHPRTAPYRGVALSSPVTWG